jgi:nitroreductase
MSERLTLTTDELLTTTRAVRKRLDFTRPVPRAVIEECLTIAQQARIMASVEYLAAHMHEAPVLVVPCIRPPDGRCESQPAVLQSSWWSSIAQAGWSFMLAARARGLGSTWTTLHLLFEEEAAQILGLPYAEVNQAGLIPVAYTRGTRFRPARRAPLDTMVHWETW